MILSIFPEWNILPGRVLHKGWALGSNAGVQCSQQMHMASGGKVKVKGHATVLAGPSKWSKPSHFRRCRRNYNSAFIKHPNQSDLAWLQNCCEQRTCSNTNRPTNTKQFYNARKITPKCEDFNSRPNRPEEEVQTRHSAHSKKTL